MTGPAARRVSSVSYLGSPPAKTKAPAVVMDHDADVIGVVEGRCAAIKRSIIEVPLGRGNLPNELRKVAPVFFIACPATVRGKIILVLERGDTEWPATILL